MSLVSSSSLAPPRSLVKESESVVIVSMQRPLCVYFNRVMDLLSKAIVRGIVDGDARSTISVSIVGCGGSIPRCKQVARYSVRGISEKLKHQVKSVVKHTKVSEGAVDVVDYILSEEADNDVVDVAAQTRQVTSVEITLVVDFS